ncbi:hypothetical protein GCM10008959_35260 [Deinococcus seoulensis]|uniref:DUF4168 domain-containing protein n=1 Tax=Deinococcus seoulensis TaxID=1837379 RepID=A0ABQ2RVY1_9DEIO|nr:hypothetical protein [Deinococcus seoulensis]GGR70488.1 hypothetical protein GCM10008959_35260 [Deinococcus seoulensis]
MKQIKTVALALGLLTGGVAIGQALSSATTTKAMSKTQSDFISEANSVLSDYNLSLIYSKSAPQTSQVANEATVQLLYIQAKQNAEIIRLLTEIKNKK